MFAFNYITGSFINTTAFNCLASRLCIPLALLLFTSIHPSCRLLPFKPHAYLLPFTPLAICLLPFTPLALFTSIHPSSSCCKVILSPSFPWRDHVCPDIYHGNPLFTYGIPFYTMSCQSYPKHNLSQSSS